jgi:hypothetical protein
VARRARPVRRFRSGHRGAAGPRRARG